MFSSPGVAFIKISGACWSYVPPGFLFKHRVGFVGGETHRAGPPQTSFLRKLTNAADMEHRPILIQVKFRSSEAGTCCTRKTKPWRP